MLFTTHVTYYSLLSNYYSRLFKIYIINNFKNNVSDTKIYYTIRKTQFSFVEEFLKKHTFILL